MWAAIVEFNSDIIRETFDNGSILKVCAIVVEWNVDIVRDIFDKQK